MARNAPRPNARALQVETARLQTRELLVVLAERRCGLADAVLAAPFELPAPPPVRDDGRPEAGRRDALALIELADDAGRRPRAGAVGGRVGRSPPPPTS